MTIKATAYTALAYSYWVSFSPVVEDDQGIQLRTKWYKGKFLLLGTTFNGQ